MTIGITIEGMWHEILPIMKQLMDQGWQPFDMDLESDDPKMVVRMKRPMVVAEPPSQNYSNRLNL